MSNLICPDGNLTDDTFSITGTGDRGLLSVKNDRTGAVLRIHKKRYLIRIDNDSGVLVLKNGDDFYAKCPKCTQVINITSENTNFVCEKHGPFKLIWKDEERPMAAATSEAPIKTQKKKQQPQQVDIASIASMPCIKLYSKASSFDHNRIAVVSYQVIYTGENPRKMCFNTYNGCLGKNSDGLPIDDFIAGNKSERSNWYDVTDVQAAETKLLKSGHTLVKCD